MKPPRAKPSVMTKECDVCGKRFSGPASQIAVRRSCSTACTKARRYKLACASCGKSFLATRQNVKYCSHGCAADAREERNSRERIGYTHAVLRTPDYSGENIDPQDGQKRFFVAAAITAWGGG